VRRNSSAALPLFEWERLATIGLKLCPKCHVNKPIAQFSRRSTTGGQRCSYCRTCQRQYCKRHYQLHKNTHNKRRYVRQKGSRQQLVQLLSNHKKRLKCIDCGEADPVVLEFDHVRGTKVDNISRMLFNASWRKIKKEIQKCEVRCANCHRRRTAQAFGWKVRDVLAEHHT
jgi:hypothetical protein